MCKRFYIFWILCLSVLIVLDSVFYDLIKKYDKKIADNQMNYINKNLHHKIV